MAARAVLLSRSQEECRARLDALWASGSIVVAESGCHVCTLKPPKAGGYPQASFDGTKVLVSHLMLRAEGRDLPRKGEDVSHFACSTPSCVHPDHVVVEPEHLNQIRKGCPGTLTVKTTAPDGTKLSGSLCLCSCVARWAAATGEDLDASLALFPGCGGRGKEVTIDMHAG